MARVIKDRIREISASVGTGPLALGVTPSPDYLPFASAMAEGDSCPGVIIAQGRGQWEVVELTMLADGRLSRAGTPQSSSNGGAPVNFLAGRKEVFLATNAADIKAAMDVGARTGAVEVRLTDLANTGSGLRTYSGNADIVPEITAPDPVTGEEKVVAGWRRSDAALVLNVPIAGTGFSAAVAGEVAAVVPEERYTGSGPQYPLWAIGPRAVAYFDATLGRVVLKDVLIQGDHGLTISAQIPYLQRTLLPANGINGFLFDGQSLSVGNSGRPVISTTQPYANLMPVGGPRSVSTPDLASFAPLIENETGELNGGGTLMGETPCSGAANFANEYAAMRSGLAPSAFTIYSCTAGNGGTAIAGLHKGTSSYNNLLRQAAAGKANADALERPFAVHAVAWIQGETDAALGTSRATYKAELLQLIADLNADIKAITGQTSYIHLLIYQTVSRITESSGAIALAQFEAAAESPLIHFVTPIYFIPHDTDHVHLINTSYRWLGAYFGRAFAQLVVEGRRPDRLWPVGATAVGTTLRVKFDVPTKPLVLDTANLPITTDHGFQVRDGTGTLTLSSATIVDGDTVQWNLNRALGSNPLVDYALTYNGSLVTGGASGNLRDSTPDTVVVNGTTRPLWHVAPHFSLPILKLAS